MSTVFLTVAPVFGLIALGYICARTRLLSEAAGKGLGEFVFTIAIPSFLFRTMLTVEPPAGAPIGLWVSYFGAIAATWIAAALVTRFVLKRPAADGAAIAMAACFGNIIMMGLPLGLGAIGEGAVTPMALIVSTSSPLLWLAATLHIEWAEQREGVGWRRRGSEFGLGLLKNFIIMSVLAGSLWRMTGIGLHPVLDKMVMMLGQAAVPTALFALGYGLVAFELKGQAHTLAWMLVLKLVFAPMVAWVLAVHVFALPPVWAAVVVMFSACPAGANAFLFANRYDRAVGSVSGAVALGTILSAFTISILLLWLR